MPTKELREILVNGKVEYSEKSEYEYAELDAQIARAATSWSPAFPGRKEVSRQIAKQARAIMHYARREDIRPSEVRFSKVGIEDGEEFSRVVEGLSHAAPRKRTMGVTVDESQWAFIKSHPEINLSGCVRKMIDELMNVEIQPMIQRAETLFSSASGQWTGLDWTYLVPPVGANKTSSVWDIEGTDASEIYDDLEAPAKTGPLCAWMAEMKKQAPEMTDPDIEDAVRAALQRAADYIDGVECDAIDAESYAETAMINLRRGAISDALDAISEASQLERKYGDDPTWGVLKRLIVEIDELRTSGGE